MSHLNKYFQQQVDNNACDIPENVKASLMDDFNLMSNIGIDSNEDQNQFFFVYVHLPTIVKDLFHKKLNKQLTAVLAADVFKNRDKYPIGTIIELMEAIKQSIDRKLPEEVRFKLAYPQGVSSESNRPNNINRWMQATRDIYAWIQKGQKYAEALDQATREWTMSEKKDFEQWLKFYQEKVPEKYTKLAFVNNANIYVTESPGFIVPNIKTDDLKARGLPTPVPSLKQSPGTDASSTDVANVKDTIENQRKKLIGRLNSAEKILSSLDGQLFAGEQLESMLTMLHDLKRKIQTAHKRTIRSSLFEDYIYRAANLFMARGQNKAAGFFYKIAQDMGPPPDMGMGGPPPPGAPPPGGAPGGEGDKEGTKKMLDEFFSNLKRGVADPDDVERDKAKLEGNDENLKKARESRKKKRNDYKRSKGYKVSDASEYWDDIIVSTAQDAAPAPPAAPLPPAPPAPPIEEAVEEPIEVTDAEPEVSEDSTEDVIEAALGKTTINDVIKRLEMLVSVYNQRELSRQLSILDIMMDKLGLSSYFPQLGEAMAKALESNQYIGSRLEGVLTRLQGSLQTPTAEEWVKPQNNLNPETRGLRQTLQENKDKENQRRELRKQRDIARLEGTEVPPEETEEMAVPTPDLQRPAKVERTQPIPTR